MKHILYLIPLVFLISCQCKHDYDPSEEEKAIRKVLSDQVIAWNKGDIDEFMKGYVHDESLTFVSSGKIKNGWEETLNRYKTNYDTREKMGKLNFDIIDLKVLDHDDAHILGKFYLRNPQDSVFATGHFTLLWKKMNEQWLIAMDHTGG